MDNKKERFENQQDYYDRISQAKDVLEEAGYYIRNLYQVEDVQSIYECTDNQAFDVLDKALDNNETANEIWENIRYFAEDIGLKEKED